MQLITGVILLFCWTVTVWLMWLGAYVKLKQRGEGTEVPGKYKAVMQLAFAIEEEVSGLGEAPEALTNNELRQRIVGKLNGGRVLVNDPLPGSGYGLIKYSWEWIKREKCWFLGLLCCLSFTPFIPLLAPLLVGMLLRATVATTQKSGLLMVLCGMALVIPCSIPLTQHRIAFL